MNDTPEKGGTSPLNFGGSSPFTSGQTEPLTDVTPEVAEAAPEAVAQAEAPPADNAHVAEGAEQSPTETPGEDTVPTETETAPVEEATATPAEQVGEVTAPAIEQEEVAPVVPADIPVIVGATDVEIDADIKARDALNAKIENGQKAQRVDVIAQIKKVVETYKIPLPELAEALGIKGTRKGSKAKPKYKDPASDKTWSGRGKEPLWIKGKNREDFLITA